ncbi:MAG: hypothetical protein ACPGWR_03935 [Ardenticatenaceae bacterium]
MKLFMGYCGTQACRLALKQHSRDGIRVVIEVETQVEMADVR